MKFKEAFINDSASSDAEALCVARARDNAEYVWFYNVASSLLGF